MRGLLRLIGLLALLAATFPLQGCNADVGVGVNVSVPVGRHGYVSVGGSRWY